MKTLTKSALSAAILAAIASTSVQAEQFIDDSSMNIHLRNYYFDRDTKTGSAKSDNDKAWSQAIRADFSSGYFADIIGFDFSSYAALRLSESLGSNKTSNTGLFHVNNKGKGEGYGKNFGAVKVNLMGNGVLKYGRMILDTPLLNDSDSRSLPSTTEAFYADYSMSGVTVFAVHAKKGNGKTESGYENYEVNGKKKAVNTFGASYSMDGLNASATYGKQSDAVKAVYLDGSYKFDLDKMTSVTVGAQYGSNKAIGFVKETQIADGEKSSIDWYGLMAKLKLDKVTLMASMTDIGGGSNPGWSDAAVGWEAGDDDTGFNGYNSVMISDFNAANETSYQVRAGYDFADMVEGLSGYVRYINGSIDMKGQSDTDTSEYDIQFDYAVPSLEGLKLTLRHGKYEKDPAGASNTYTREDTRVLVTYDVTVF